jgi:hypothetical protein
VKEISLRVTRLLALALALASIRAAGQTPDEIGKVADATLESLDVQRQLPSEAQSPATKETAQEVEVIRLPASPPDAKDLDAKGPWSALLRMLIWMAAICAVVLILAYADVTFPGFRRRLGGTAAADDSAEESEVQRASHPAEILLEADRFADSGQYSEAMHRLLVDTVALLRKRLDADVSDSLTSRELLRVLALGAVEKQAFQDIVTRVEESWFGERLARADDYAVVRRSFQTFQTRTAETAAA